MSYDIWFCQRSDEPLDRLKLRETLALLPHTTESQSNDGTVLQFAYENPDTGVYCLFDLYDPDRKEGIEVATGHIPVGLSVSINFLRPSFFAVELMPIIIGVAEAAGILAIDPQQDDPLPEVPNAAVLIDRWIDHNDRATWAVAKQQDQPIIKPYMPREEAMRWVAIYNGEESFSDRTRRRHFRSFNQICSRFEELCETSCNLVRERNSASANIPTLRLLALGVELGSAQANRAPHSHTKRLDDFNLCWNRLMGQFRE